MYLTVRFDFSFYLYDMLGGGLASPPPLLYETLLHGRRELASSPVSPIFSTHARKEGEPGI